MVLQEAGFEVRGNTRKKKKKPNKPKQRGNQYFNPPHFALSYSVLFVIAANVNNCGLYAALVMVPERILFRCYETQLSGFNRRVIKHLPQANPVVR